MPLSSVVSSDDSCCTWDRPEATAEKKDKPEILHCPTTQYKAYRTGQELTEMMRKSILRGCEDVQEKKRPLIVCGEINA